MDCSPPGSSVHEIFPGKDTGVGCHFLLQGIFPTQGSNPVLQADSLPTELQGKPYDRPRPCIKNKDITLLTKVYIVKAMVFPVVMYRGESWAIKKAECERTDAFKPWCRRKLLSPVDCKEINQSILKETSPECSLEGLMLKLKLKYFGHFMQRADSLEKTLMLGKIERGWRRGWQRMRWLDGITDSMNMNLGKLREMVKDREAWHAEVHGISKSWTRLGVWIITRNDSPQNGSFLR